MLSFFKKSIISLLMALLIVEPVFIFLPDKAKATTETDDTTKNINIDGGDETEITQSTVPVAIQSLASQVNNSAENASSYELGFEDQIMGMQDARLIFNRTDLAAIRSLYCLSDLLPDFYTDLEAMYNFLPTSFRPASIDELAKIRIRDYNQFQNLVYEAQKAWGKSPDPRTILNQEKNELKNNADSGVDPVMQNLAVGNEQYKNLKCITGLDTQQLIETDSEYLDQIITSALESTTIDIRIIKMLNYLVIPKNQGGAGHWRVRVKKLIQDTARPYSNESEAVRLSLGQKITETRAVDCANMTAAECGVAQGSEEDSNQANANITAEDENGDTYDAYLESLDNAETGYLATAQPPDRNISAHTKGQAVDIMELDDIRCTLTVVKKRRIGGSSTTREKKVLRPIKLAWQTSASYDQSGGNSVDMMGIMKDIANDEMRTLVDDLNGDVTNYDGDLSDANFSDIVGIIGKTIFGQLLNSPGHNFAGFNTEDTLQKLGAMYFADYLGLPREIFIGRSITSLEDLQVIIGETALEKRAGLPFGSLESLNYKKSAGGAKVYDLEGTLTNAGKRKLEFEMNLDPGDLKEYEEGLTVQSLSILIGNRVIEKGLNIPKNSFRGANYKELKKNLGDFRAGVLFQDPTYIDNTLHITPGTAKQLISGNISPFDFVEKVGETRKNDTINGFNYLSANNAAYNLPDGAWSDALLGKATGFITVGRFALSRVIQQNLTFSKYLYGKGGGNLSEEQYLAMKDLNITATPDDIGAAAAQSWLLENLTKTDQTTCQIPDNKITKKVTVTIKKADGSTEIKDLDVDINEERAFSLGLVSGDLSRMFGCALASPRSVFSRIGSKLLYYGVANKLLDSDGKVKIDLMDTTPELQTNNPEINFYLSRVGRVLELTQKIKGDWNNETGVELGPINEHINAILRAFNNLNVTTIAGAKETARSIAYEVDGLFADCENIRIQNQSKARKVDTTILNVNELIRAVSEIMAGKVIASADLLTIKQINASQSFSSTWTSAGNSGTTSAQNSSNGSSSGGIRSTGFSPAALFDLVTHRISATDFFVRIGAAQAENGLGLPQNSIYYLVQNYEKAGIKNIDAFYLAIGQAKIEQEFSMPSFYFQGDVLNDKIPDFKKDYKNLVKYAESQIETWRSYFAWGGSTSIPSSKPEDYVKWVKSNDPNLFESFVDTAKLNWLDEYVTEWANNGGQLMNERDLSDVAHNIVSRGYNDAIRGAGDDIMFRLGISGRLAALEAGGFSTTANNQAVKVDRRLGIKEGSTAALIKKQKVPLSNGADLLEINEKQQLAQSLNLSGTDLIDVLLKLINGDIKLNQLGRQGLDADYIETNPYLKQYGDGGDENSCPITYTGTDNKVTWEDFENRTDIYRQTTFEGNTYCIVDKVGKHCFKNKTDAQTYSVDHSADQFADVLDALAIAIKTHAGLSVSESLKSTGNIRERLIQFINGTINSVFTDEEYSSISDGGLTLATLGDAYLNVDVLKRLLSRENDQTPLATYKRAVGHAESKRILSWKLFTSLGIDIPPGIFNGNDLYAILNGDLKPLYRIGAYYLDETLGFNPGTTQLIVSALNPKNLKCALADAGAKMLGSFVGLNSVPIRASSPADLLQNIGESKIEETLGLPKGMFRGASMSELIAHIKPMNFALIFKIPIYTERLDNGETLTTISRNDLEAILGVSRANSLKSATGTFQLRSIVNYLSSAPALTAEATTAVANIDSKLPEYIQQILSAYGAGALQNGTDQKMRDYYYEINQFKTFWDSLDNAFGLDFGETAKLARGEISPDQYNEKIGSKMAIRIGAVELGKALGLDDYGAEAAANIALNFKKFFICDNMSPIAGEGCRDKTYYQNWGMLYSNLSMIFQFDLDTKAKLPPGTFQRIFNDPSQAHWVILEIAATKLDDQFKLEGTLTLSELYRRVYSSQNNRIRDDHCVADSKAASGIDTNQLMLAMQANQKIIDKGSADSATPDDVANASIAKADNDKKGADINLLNSVIQKCQNDWRAANDNADAPGLGGIGAITAEWLRDGISEKIHNAIIEIEVDGERVGVNMPIEDIKQMVFWGDLRYFQIVGMAMAVNIYQVKNTDERHPVPIGMRVSYEDIRQAFFPDATVLFEARNAATWAYYNGEAADNSRVPLAYGDFCPGNMSFVQSLVHCTPDYKNASTVPTRGQANLVNAGVVSTDMRYNYNPATNFSNSDTLLHDWEEDRTNYNSEIHNLITSERCQRDMNSCQGELDNFEQMRDNADTAVNEISGVQRDAERVVRKTNMEILEYRMVDQMLYGADQNIFPGFSYALFKGNSEVKTAALHTYIYNGLKNGNLFGLQFGGIPNLDDWLPVVGFVDDIGRIGQQAAFDKFASGKGFDFLSNFVAGKSSEWLGFSLSPEMVGGILVGGFTGKWGKFSPLSNDETNVYTVGNKNIPTLGNVATKWAVQSIFAWADKALGLPIGKSYEFFAMAKEIYQAQKTLALYRTFTSDQAGIAKILGMKDALNKTKEGKAVVDAATNAQNGVAGAKEALDSANKALTEAKQLQNLQLQISIYTKIATYFIDRWLAGTYSDIEESLNLVPGSLPIVVDAAVGIGVTSLVAHGASRAALMNSAVSGFYVALAIFVLVNLFGVYKVDIKLTCNADGYWPEFEPIPSSNVADISGIGTWDGMNAAIMKRKTIEAAQYKASRLIGDILYMQENDAFKDIVPSQIMTGRAEDVKTWNNVVSDYMCKWIGLTAQGGICGGNTRAGIWANPQTIAWTHIGY